MRTRTLWTACGAGLTLTTLLAGCVLDVARPAPRVPSSKEKTLTPQEALDQVVALADAAGTVLGPEWKSQSNTFDAKKSFAAPCTLVDGREGMSFDLPLWIGPGVTDPETMVKKIQDLWKKLGTDVPVVKDTDGFVVVVLSDPAYLTGTYPDGYIVTLAVGHNGSTLDAQTHCVRGDATKWNLDG